MHGNDWIMLLIGVLVGMLVLVVVDGVARPDTGVEQATRLCESSGGTAIMTEYNTVNGLTINCFYPAATVEEANAQDV